MDTLGAEFSTIAQIAAVVALVVTASILTSGCLTLVFNVQKDLIEYDDDGNVITFDDDAVSLRSRMLRFPNKAGRFYYWSISSVLIISLFISLRSTLNAYFPEDFAPVLGAINEPAVGILLSTIFLTFLSSYALFLGHSIILYKRIYGNIKIRTVPNGS